MKRQVMVLFSAIVLSLACQPLAFVAEQAATSTPAPRATPLSVSASVLTETPPPTPALLPTLAALATLQAASAATIRPTTAATATPVRAAPTSPPTSGPVTIPSNWKQSTDSSGTCQVSTPPNWQMGKDFFLALEPAAPSPLTGMAGDYPPRGAALWGVSDLSQLPKGTRYQERTSLVIGDKVCSVWRIKDAVDFTVTEKTEMQQVGKTLKAVHP